MWGFGFGVGNQGQGSNSLRIQGPLGLWGLGFGDESLGLGLAGPGALVRYVQLGLSEPLGLEFGRSSVVR